MRIPSTAKAQLERAMQLGHHPYIERQSDDRLYFVCSCGVRSTRRRSERAVRQTMAWHLGKVIGMGEDLARLNGGPPIPSGSSPEPSAAGPSQARERAERPAAPAPGVARSG